MTFSVLIEVTIKRSHFEISWQELTCGKKLELLKSSCLLHMAFKLPSLKLKKHVQSSPALQDLRTFKWSDLSDKEEIGRGSFGSVFLAKFGESEFSKSEVKEAICSAR